MGLQCQLHQLLHRILADYSILEYTDKKLDKEATSAIIIASPWHVLITWIHSILWSWNELRNMVRSNISYSIIHTSLSK